MTGEALDSPLSFSSFVLPDATRRLLGDERFRARAIASLRTTGVDKVYIAAYCEELVPRPQLEDVKALFESAGFEAAGGVATGLWGEAFGEQSSNFTLTHWEGVYTEERKRLERTPTARFEGVNTCLSSRATLLGLRTMAAEAARVFDEVLTDDILANWCFCPRCMAVFSEAYGFEGTFEDLATLLTANDELMCRNWEEHGFRLVRDAFADWFIPGARETNSEVKLTLKVAEWYEMYPFRGIFISELSKLFDGLQVGSECRENAVRGGSFVPPQLGRRLAGSRFRGAWVDFLNDFSWWELSTTPDVFLPQVRESVLGQATEICLFSLDEQADPRRDAINTALADDLPMLRRLAGVVSDAPVGGLDVLMPESRPHATFHPEAYLLDILLSIGLPLNVCTDPTEVGDHALITAHAARAVDEEWLRNRRTVFLTSGALHELAAVGNRPVLRLAGLDEHTPLGQSVVQATALTFGDGTFPWPVFAQSRTGALPVGPSLNTDGGAEVLLAGRAEGREHAVVARRRDEATTVCSIALTCAPRYLIAGYPESIRELVRDLAGEAVGYKLNARGEGLTGVSLHVYGNGLVVIHNMEPRARLARLLVRDETEWTTTDVDLRPSELTCVAVSTKDGSLANQSRL